MTTHSRTSLWGIANAIGAAFVWALLVIGYDWRGKDWFPGIPSAAALAVLAAIWYVVPLGALVGLALPRLVKNHSGWQAFLRGAGVGLIVACITALLLSQGDEQSFLADMVTMFPVCAIWLGVWAARMTRKRIDS